MALTTAQLQALGAYIAADPVLSAYPTNSDGAFAIAEALNQTASPAFVVWRTSVPRADVMAEGFDWTQVDNLTAGGARIWDWLFASGAMNAADAGQRAGVEEAWKGTAAKLAVRAFVLGKCKRNATVAEKLLASGTGSDASPATMGWEGALSYQDVQAARAA